MADLLLDIEDILDIENIDEAISILETSSISEEEGTSTRGLANKDTYLGLCLSYLEKYNQSGDDGFLEASRINFYWAEKAYKTEEGFNYYFNETLNHTRSMFEEISKTKLTSLLYH